MSDSGEARRVEQVPGRQEPHRWRHGTWLRREQTVAEQAALAGLDRWLGYPSGGRTSLDLPGGRALPEFFTGAPEHLAAAIPRGRTDRLDQSGLPDAWVTLDEDRLAMARGRLSRADDKWRELVVPADRLVS